MKHFIALLLAVLFVLSCAFAETQDDDIAAYTEIIGSYDRAIRGGLSYQDCEEDGINPMAADCDAVGYAVTDLDGDGISELIIASCSDDEFFCGMVFEMYTCRDDAAVRVFSSSERDRYYFAGGCDFVHEGSSGADDSFETTVRYAGGELTDLGVEGEHVPADIELTPLGI